ncbi:MAG TPA: phosphoserine phosphatase SerB [Myxococcales bacterium]|jgi:phosphoserine phosphatase|nr:phosphoserine phosphatase SerB [Myxococcales bacterium]
MERLLLTFTGRDAPGITARITEVLAGAGARLHDVEQVVVHGFLVLAFAVAFDSRESEERALKDLLFAAKQRGLSMEYAPLPAAEPLPRQRFAVTAISRQLGPEALHAVSGTLAAHGGNIESIQRLSEGGLQSVEFAVSLPAEADASALKRALLFAAGQGSFDCALQKESLLRRSKRLVVMDMDSTLIRIEVIDELAREHGVGEQVAAITRRAMLGEMDYDRSLRERVALLRGLPAEVLYRLATSLPLAEGAETLLRVLQRLGYRTAVISGGFSHAAEALKKRLGIDYAWSNTLEIEGGKLTGRVLGPIVNAQRKADLLEDLARRERVPLDQVIAVGDGANDLLMLQKAGHGIAFHAKPKLREAAHTSISAMGLDAILYLLGITGRDIQDLAEERA